jgi:hypothetical protein
MQRYAIIDIQRRTEVDRAEIPREAGRIGRAINHAPIALAIGGVAYLAGVVAGKPAIRHCSAEYLAPAGRVAIPERATAAPPSRAP